MADHFRDGAAAIRQPFCVYGADERLVAYNQAFADLHLLPDGSCLLHPGIAFQEIMEWRKHIGFFAKSPHGDQAATDHYKLVHGDVIYQLADGRWMFVDNTPLPDGRLACIWSDITAVKEAERQLWELTRNLHRSQDHLYRAQRVAHVGSIERDLRTGAVTWTPETYEIFGRDPTLPPPARDQAPKLFHPEDRARYRAVMEAAERGEVSPPAEFRVVRPDGSIRWVYHESEVVVDDAGKPRLRVGTFRDVTEIHQYQEQQRALQNELLSRERLSAIGSVTERVARELRDPLSTIKNSLFMIKAEPIRHTPSSERAVGRIERSSERCNQIISDLLEYSHSSPLRPRPHGIDDWLREVVAGLAVAPPVAIKLDLRAPAVAEFDAGQLGRAVLHVLENAVQAVAEEPGGSPRIVLRSRLRADEAEITITDNGPGIAPEALGRCFEPLFSTKRFGTGLGLTTAHQIVEQHGGTIELWSRLNTGTKARIRLPLASAVAVRKADLPSAA
jgi:signal transduction histidine kinase